MAELHDRARATDRPADERRDVTGLFDGLELMRPPLRGLAAEVRELPVTGGSPVPAALTIGGSPVPAALAAWRAAERTLAALPPPFERRSAVEAEIDRLRSQFHLAVANVAADMTGGRTVAVPVSARPTISILDDRFDHAAAEREAAGHHLVRSWLAAEEHRAAAHAGEVIAPTDPATGFRVSRLWRTREPLAVG